MILPLGDSPNPPGVPFVTYALLVANVTVFGLITVPLSAMAPDLADPALTAYLRTVVENVGYQVPAQQILAHTSAYDVFVYQHGFRPADPNFVDLLTSLFLHAGFLHLAGNMLFLWIYGDNVEHRLGHLRYLLAYVGTGIAATLFHAAFQPSSQLPLIGASGAISGVLGFYFLWFPRNAVRLLLLFPFLLRVTVPARVLIGVYIVLENLVPFLLTRGGGASGIAYGAHIGGFLSGLATAWLMDRREMAARPREYRRVRTRPMSEHPSAETIGRRLAAGQFAAAANAYFALAPESTRGILEPEDSLALAEWLRRNRHARAALVLYRRHLRDYPRGPGAAEAHFGAGMIQLEAMGQATAAYQHFLDALEHDPPPETAMRPREALAAITGR